jgi:hypothetical protein
MVSLLYYISIQNLHPQPENVEVNHTEFDVNILLFSVCQTG